MPTTCMLYELLWILPLISIQPAFTFQLRLINGTTDSSGRVEVNFDDGDGWGTVCDDDWDSNDAKVVCQSLGYIKYQAFQNAKFGTADGMIRMVDVNCTGSETSLNECEYNVMGNCSQNETASVICSVPQFQIRLADGGTNFQGRVEVNLNGSGWGTVCDDHWDTNDAKVVCRSLGLPYSTVIPTSSAFFGRGKGLIHMDDVECYGSESSLHNCRYINSSNETCDHDEDAGVICLHTQDAFKPVIQNTDSRIARPKDGGLRVLLTEKGNLTVSVCDDKNAKAITKVACYEKFRMRYSHTHLETYDYRNIRRSSFCVRFNCTGNENRLSQCPASTISTSYSYIPPGIVCGYEQAQYISLNAERIMGRYIIMTKGNNHAIRCETTYARPKPSISWIMDGNYLTEGFMINGWTNVSGTLHKSLSTIIIKAYDINHGMIIKCCKNDTFGHSLCTRTYNLFVIDFSRKLNRLGVTTTKQQTTEPQNHLSIAPQQKLEETSNSKIDISIVLSALSVCAVIGLICKRVIRVTKCKSSYQTKNEGRKENEGQKENGWRVVELRKDGIGNKKRKVDYEHVEICDY